MLTVITPVMNGGVHIRGCLENVIAQGVDELEHIIADGGSNDGTLAIVEEYRAKYPHVRLLNGPDLGQSDAINKATAIAKGELIGILNVDDRYRQKTLAKVRQAFESHAKPAIGVGDCEVFDADGELLYINQPRYLGLKAYLLGFPYPVNPVAYFYHRELHERIGGYDVDDHYAMDLDFLCAASKAGSYFRIPGVLGSFHMIAESKTVSDQQQNKGPARVESILRRYAEEFPLPARAFFRGARFFVRLGRKVCGRTWVWTSGHIKLGGCN